ncbi:hypothetical protein ABL78_1779 [Leptomonas seymouri]|uniref:Uncharacterized protein n=1 Tax=Leptomonas seymouri TaxID=5684 RepID=A0A0N1PFQ6_LEPSE|nr:hypothetical protein ABL78_1779 [Leptomonas seymouri]|eukprot:KPI89135.1 hypothetical protein ABL78_1779 [Leptomonas seymouri]
MNQLEYFLASTEGSRADVMRYMQRLRDLDEWIEYHLSLLRAITANRVVYLAGVAREESSRHRGGRGASGRGRGRGRSSGTGHGGPFTTATPPHVYDVDSGESAEKVGADSCAALSPDAAAAAHMAELQRQFEWHETCVRQHCQEREILAAELAERCAEVRLSMASRLANFASVADVPVTELAG